MEFNWSWKHSLISTIAISVVLFLIIYLLNFFGHGQDIAYDQVYLMITSDFVSGIMWTYSLKKNEEKIWKIKSKWINRICLTVFGIILIFIIFSILTIIIQLVMNENIPDIFIFAVLSSFVIWVISVWLVLPRILRNKG